MFVCLDGFCFSNYVLENKLLLLFMFIINYVCIISFLEELKLVFVDFIIYFICKS